MRGRDLKLRLQEDYRRSRAWTRFEASTTGGSQDASRLDGSLAHHPGFILLEWKGKSGFADQVFWSWSHAWPALQAHSVCKKHGGARADS